MDISKCKKETYGRFLGEFEFELFDLIVLFFDQFLRFGQFSLKFFRSEIESCKTRIIYFYELSKIITVIRLKSEVLQLVQINYKWLFGLSIEIAELDCTFKNQFNESWTLQNAYKIVFE
jgi:hypothetical protein